ncbi:BQ2448_4395 [Microbotryum intermedium]|uniref:BQ2448_4395 protein n=1 Tax=Microbotryum intermedium TaxID=269621 RepID=A0A238FNS5_9BASI|nr:BQ2448_4395 [Microbotryum intermedium]
MPTSLGMFKQDLSDPPLLGPSMHRSDPLHGHSGRKAGDSNLSCCAVREQLEPQAPLPSGSQRPVAALQDISLEKRVHEALTTFLGEHGFADKVLAKADELLRNAPHPIFCNEMPECTATIHDWRIRVLEPLLKFVLRHYNYKTTGSPVDPDQYRLFFSMSKASQPSGIRLFLIEKGRGGVSRLPIIFEDESNFLTFGPQPNLFAREGECKLHLEQEDPIPLDPTVRSHGAQAILNKLAVSMESAILRNSATGEIYNAPRFGMMISTRISILAEIVENPQNPQEVGFLFSSILLDPRDHTDINFDLPLPFHFIKRSLTHLVLAVLVDYLTHTPAPSPETVTRLFGPPKVDSQEWRKTRKQSWKRDLRAERVRGPAPSSVEVWDGRLFAVRAKLDYRKKPLRFIYRPQGRMGGFLPYGSDVMEAVKFKVIQKPQSTNAEPSRKYKSSRRLSVLPPSLIAYLECGIHSLEGLKKPRRLSRLDVEDPETLPVLNVLQLIGIGGVGWVYGGKLSRARSQSEHHSDVVPTKEVAKQKPKVELGDQRTPGTTLQLQTMRSRIAYDQPVVIKVFKANEWDSIIIESLFYEHVFPILSPEAQALLPRYYGTFRSTDGDVMMLVLGYGGRGVDSEDLTGEMGLKIDEAFEIFERQGVSHGDTEYWNVLIRDDDTVCIIDWNHATLDFDPANMRDPV